MGFLVKNARWLGAGAVLAFASGFGQTFFISLYASEIRAEFDLSHGAWGGIYTAGTLLSAAVMLWAGSLVDKFRTPQIATIILTGLALTCLAMAFNQSVIGLILVIFGLRFFGQGMLGHTAIVSAGRWFARNRGRAVSITSLGFSVAEAGLPILFVALAVWVDWRSSWIIAAIATAIWIFVIRPLARVDRDPKSEAETTVTTGMGNRHWTRRETISHWLFWLMLPTFLGPPMFSTALFFQQVHLAETKGWTLVAFVSLIPVSTATSIVMMLAAGWLVDRSNSRWIVCVCILPLAASFVAFGTGTTLVAAAVAFWLHGMTQGMVTTIGGTFWAEHYGTENLGAIRATAVSVMVFGSAIGPGITGVLIDAGYAFEDQMLWISAYLVASAALATFAILRLNRADDSA